VLFPIKKTVNMWGFTLIEMLVVISVIIILTLITVPIYQGSKKELALQRATGKLAQDLRSAQEMAMAAKEFQGAVPEGGYGIYLTSGMSDRYILFADTNGNFQYGDGELVDDIYFETGVEISQLSPASPLTITFTPPDPTTRVNGSTSTAAAIILRSENSTTSINVLPTGLIFIE